MPTIVMRPAGAHHGEALGQAGLAADAVDHHVGAAGEPVDVAVAEGERAGAAAHRPLELGRLDHRGGAELPGQLPLHRVLGHGDDGRRRA